MMPCLRCLQAVWLGEDVSVVLPQHIELKCSLLDSRFNVALIFNFITWTGWGRVPANLMNGRISRDIYVTSKQPSEMDKRN